MVRAVSSPQFPVFREFVETSEFLRSLPAALKQVCFLFVFLSTGYWTLNTAMAKDFGVQGKISPIEEEDSIVLIQNKLKGMEERGELKAHNIELQKKTRASVERPKPVKGITKTQETRIFYFDPSYVVPKDLKDHTGKIFAAKGTKINPLETVSLSHTLFFFDGDDAEQKELAIAKLKLGSIKLILVKGAPLALSRELNVPVYFDQAGILTKKLGITHVPALVTQESLLLRIEETELEKANNNCILPEYATTSARTKKKRKQHERKRNERELLEEVEFVGGYCNICTVGLSKSGEDWREERGIQRPYLS